MRVQYVGLRDDYKDGIYGTGKWVKGQVKEVPGEIAAKMCQHVDQYVSASPVDERATVENDINHVDVVGAEPVSAVLGRFKVAVLDKLFADGLEQDKCEDLGHTMDEIIAIFAGSAADPGVEVVVIKEQTGDSQEEKTQETRDLIANMDIEALKVFAKVNFNKAIHPNMKVENARIAVTNLVDQFGVV